MKHVSLSLTISLMIVSAVVGIGFGYYVTPEYQATMYEKTMGLGAPDRWVDKRYLEKMIAHHETAIDLANQASVQSQRPEIKALAEDIKANEPKLIAELYEWKKSWYSDNSKIINRTSISLGESGESFDLRFLNALIDHHSQGIEMTQEIKTKSVRSEVLDNANIVENFLRTTKKTLEGMRFEWYGVKGEE